MKYGSKITVNALTDAYNRGFKMGFIVGAVFTGVVSLVAFAIYFLT